MRHFAAAWLLALSCAAGAQQPLEHEVKAAFLFKFPSFVEWPRAALGEAPAPLVIGVAGADDAAAALEQMSAGRGAQGRPLQVKRLQEGESIAGVHMLFLGRGMAPRLRDISRSTAGQPMLVVCEWDGALEQGAAINFLRTDGRVRFEVALDAVERRGLRISSRMLAVAANVRGAKP
jgi:hypothetical protein